MNAHKSNLINSIVLIALGIWVYLDTGSISALIPVGFGTVLIACSNGLKNQNKIVSHLCVLFTMVILIALIGMRLPKSLESGGIGLLRVLVMISTSSLAMVYFVRSFINTRKST